MTKCKLEKIGNRFYVEIYGHSNYAENNKDIVCAGVSTLALSFAILCEIYEDKGKCHIEDVQINEGLVVIIVDTNNDCLDSAFEMLKTGLKQLEETYPKNVCVKGGNLNI